MTRERWAQVKEILDAALEQPAGARRRWLETQCAPELRTEAERMLTAYEAAESSSFLDVPAPALPGWDEGEKPERIGPYEVRERIGQGGMGEVWRVWDTRLEREVALKILLPEYRHLEVLRRRFGEEAKAASALEHPRICRVYDVGEYEGRPYITMELLEGETLRERLKRGACGEREAARIGAEVAEALGAAHARGFVHRDVKPGNIFLTPEGVKVVDFGLAQRVEGAAGSLPAAGTPAYMAPEQKGSGAVVDARSDLYSLGVVVGEMAVGRRPAEGAMVGGRLGAAVRRAMEGDPARRYQTAGEMAAALRGVRDPVRRWWMVAGAMAAAGLAGVLVWQSSGGKQGGEASQLMPRVVLPGRLGMPSFAPVGNDVAFSWGGMGPTENLDVYRTTAGAPRRLTENPEPDRWPAWSPDGKQILFFRGGRVAGYYLVGADGGPERELVRVGEEPILNGGRPHDWWPGGKRILYWEHEESGHRLKSLDLRTGERKVMVTGEPYVQHPAVSPDGRWIAFVLGPGTFAHDLYVMRSDGSERRRLTEDGAWIGGITWTRDSEELVFSSERSGVFGLWRIRRQGGGPEAVAGAGYDAWHPTVSGDGKWLGFETRKVNVNLWRLPAEAGGVERAKAFVVSSRLSLQADASPDGNRLVFVSNRAGPNELWVQDGEGREPRRLTAEKEGGSPRFSPDGKWIAFDARREGHADVFVIDVEGKGTRRLTRGAVDEYLPSWSRDGKWIYYVSEASGQAKCYRVAAEVSGGGGGVLVSEDRCEYAQETWDGTALLYASAGQLKRRELATGRVRIEQPKLFWREFAVSAQGIYWIEDEEEGYFHTVRMKRTGSERVETIGRIGPRAHRQGPIAVSPDGKWIFYDRRDQRQNEVMMLSGYR